MKKPVLSSLSSATKAVASAPAPAVTLPSTAPVALTPEMIAQNALPHTVPNPGYTWVDATVAINGNGKLGAIPGHWERPRAGQKIVMGPYSGPANVPVAPAANVVEDHRPGGNAINSGVATVTTTDKKTGVKTTTEAVVSGPAPTATRDSSGAVTVTSAPVDIARAHDIAAEDAATQKAKADAAAAAKSPKITPLVTPKATAPVKSSLNPAMIAVGAALAYYLISEM